MENTLPIKSCVNRVAHQFPALSCEETIVLFKYPGSVVLFYLMEKRNGKIFPRNNDIYFYESNKRSKVRPSSNNFLMYLRTTRLSIIVFSHFYEQRDIQTTLRQNPSIIIYFLHVYNVQEIFFFFFQQFEEVRSIDRSIFFFVKFVK